MKLFIAVFALIAVASADFTVKTTDDLQTYRTECVSAHDIPEEMVQKYKKWEFPEDDKTQCYIKCVFNEMGLFDDSTGPIVDNLVQQLAHGRDADEVRTEVLKCVDKNTDDNACHWAFRGFKCFQKNNLQLIKASIKKD